MNSTLKSLIGGLAALLVSACDSPASNPTTGDTFAQLDGAPWTAPVNLASAINSSQTDAQPAISPDGLSLYFVSNRSGNNDIWVSRRASQTAAWGPAARLSSPINTNGLEGSPAFSQDGHLLFFHSDRPGGQGLADVYVASRDDVTSDVWGQPQNVGTAVNTAGFEGGVFYSQNSQILYFGRGFVETDLDIVYIPFSAQTRTTSGTALFIAELSDRTVGVNDARPTVRADDREIIFYSDRVGGRGSNDLWIATRAGATGTWSPPTNLAALNTASSESTPALSFDGRTLFFASNRTGGLGGADIWQSTRGR